MTGWKWCTCAPSFKDKCPGCNESARTKRDGLVEYRGQHWHVDCLLHAAPDLPAPPITPGFWGLPYP